jgi:hypothetical protein
MNIYNCKLCHKEFNSKRALTSHMNWHNPNYAKKSSCISESARSRRATLEKNKKESKELLYYKTPNFCKSCENILIFSKRNNKFCSHSCAATITNQRETIQK